MKAKTRILLTGIEHGMVQSLDALLRAQPWFDVTTKLGSTGKSLLDARNGNDTDIVVLSLLGSDWQSVLNSVPAQKGVNWVLVVLGPADNMAAMRQAMQLGARDYITTPFNPEEVSDTLRGLARERSAQETSEAGHRITTVVNTKGGSGGSFIAASLAHMIAAERGLHTALIDGDLQFGIQGLTFDITLQHGIKELLPTARQLDPVALQGYMAKHKSGLHILGEKLDEIVLPGDLSLSEIERLMDLLAQGFDHTVVDLPRQIDLLFSAVVSRSHHVFLITQQSVAHIRDTKRLVNILRREFEMSPQQITIVVNRYHEKSTISVDDIRKTTGHDAVVTVANDFKRVAIVTDNASPLSESAPNAAITRDLRNLANLVCGVDQAQTSFIKRAFGGIFGA